MNLSDIKEFTNHKKHFFRGNYDEALRLIRKAIEIVEKDTDFNKDNFSILYESLGETLFFNGLKEEALDTYDKSIKNSKYPSMSRVNYAVFLAGRVKDYNRAIKMCEEAVASFSDEPVEDVEDHESILKYYEACTYAIKGYSYAMSGDLENAKKYFLLLHNQKKRPYVNLLDEDLCYWLEEQGCLEEEVTSYLKRWEPTSEEMEYNQLVKFDLDKKQILIYRLHKDGREVVDTSIDVSDVAFSDKREDFDKVAKKLGSNILIGAPEGRKLFPSE